MPLRDKVNLMMAIIVDHFSTLRTFWRYKWVLFGTASTWFLFDITFYANGLFKETIVNVRCSPRLASPPLRLKHNLMSSDPLSDSRNERRRNPRDKGEEHSACLSDDCGSCPARLLGIYPLGRQNRTQAYPNVWLYLHHADICIHGCFL